MINRKAIEKATLHKLKISTRYEYRPKKTFLGFTITPAGVYDMMYDERMPYVDSIIVKDRLVFDKPHVTVRMFSGAKEIFRFETNLEAEKFFNELAEEV